MDTPTLDGPEDWIAVVGEVLTSRGVGLSTRERLLAALRAAPSPEATRALLEARRASDAAWLAPTDGTLELTETGAQLMAEGSFGKFCAQEWRGDAQRFVLSHGVQVRAGDPLTSGEPDPQEWLSIFGAREALPLIRQRLTKVAGLDEASAELLLGPMLDGARLKEPGDSRLPEGTLMTRERFDRECGTVLRRNLSDTSPEDPLVAALLALDTPRLMERYCSAQAGDPVRDLAVGRLPVGELALLGYQHLRSMDTQGLVLGEGHLVDCGTIEVQKGTLSVSDIGVVKRHVERNAERAAQQAFGARKGAWRVQLHLHRHRVLALRLFHEQHVPVLDNVRGDALVEVSSAAVLICDLRKEVAAAATEGTLRLTERLAQSGKRGVALVESFGVVTSVEPGNYRVQVERGPDGLVVALGLDVHVKVLSPVE